LQDTLQHILNAIKNHESAWPFQDPVNPEDVPDYYDIIKEPMDLHTIGQRLHAGFYRSRDIFVADVRLIFDNCRLYNREDTEYYACASALEEYFKQQMRKLK
jgi:histone acetyltransferase